MSDLGASDSDALTSNGRPLPRTSRYLGTLRASEMSVFETGVARQRFAADGYLFVRGALPRERVLALRKAYFELFEQSFLKDGDARRGEFSGSFPAGLPAHGVKGHPAHRFVRSREFAEFRALPRLTQMAEVVVGEAVAPVQRAPVRHFVRGSRSASRPHVDRTYLDVQGDAAVTLWIPLGDCPLEAGALLYLEGSHEDGGLERRLRPFAPTDRSYDARPLTHDLKWLSDITGRRWLGVDFEAGDVVLHSPDIVHASTDCQTSIMRLSTDLRFQRVGTRTDTRWSGDWAGDDGH